MEKQMLVFLMVSLVLSLSLGSQVSCGEAESIAAISVTAHGAVGDGKTDDTAAFQKALNAAAEKGSVVLAPAGMYVIARTLDIPDGVTLRGVWEHPHHTGLGKGTVLMATGGAGDENGKPFISLVQNSCIKGVTIFYPEQSIDDVKPYPWTISGVGMHCSVINVTLVNPYKGIQLETWGELHNIRDVYGCPLVAGISVDNCTDIGRIENVHFNPHYWTRAGYPGVPHGEKGQKVIEFLEKNLVAFKFGRTDWQYVTNCFCIFAKIGYHFVRTKAGEPNVVLTQCGADIGPIAVQVDNCAGHAGVSFSNSQMMAQVIIGPDNYGPVKFSNCGFWPVSVTENQAVIQGHGTTTFANCHFHDWGIKNQEAPCILAKGGSLIVNACEFVAPKPQIQLDEAVETAVITSNRLRGGAKITNNSKGDTQIGLNVEK